MSTRWTLKAQKKVAEMVTLTVYVVKSFAYRNMKTLVVQNVDLTTTGEDLKKILDQKIQTLGPFVPYRKQNYDSLRILGKQHGAKPNNIFYLNENNANLDMTKTLQENGVEEETELTYFNAGDLASFLTNPETKW